MLDEFRIETTTVGSYIDRVNDIDGDISVDQAVQREFCWSNEMINNLVYSTISKKRIYIPNIILAEENNDDGTKKTYVVDGGQRTEALRRFIKGGHKITKSIRNRYVEYQGVRTDKKGNVILDDDGKSIPEIIQFDLVGKTFNDFPEKLKKRMIGCILSTAIYQDCTPEETSDLVMLYNSTIAMNISQKSLTYIGKYADKLKYIKDNNKFLANGTMLGENDKKKGIWQRVIAECAMAMFYFDDWKKNPRDICAYLNENATEKDFDDLENYFNRLIPYSDKLKDIEVVELFVPKDLPVWMMFFKKAECYCSDYDFGRFLLAFNDMKEIERNDTTWIELDKKKQTKDRKLILEKVNYLDTLLKEFLHINNNANSEGENNTYEEVKESEVEETKTEEFDKKVEETINDSEMENLDFVRKYVSEDIEEEDLEQYWNYIDGCANKSRIIKGTSQLLAPENENSILAMVAWSDKHNKNIATWLQRFSITHKTMPDMSQKERFETMVKSYLKFEQMQDKVATA